jgi:spore maturation protein SpmA/spore maturation protein SpmB
VNIVFFALVAISFGVTAVRQVSWVAASPTAVAPMQQLGVGMIEAATSSVTLALGLIGVMALFLGLMKIAEAGGLLTIIARLVRPLMVRLFPDVPADHPAMGAMIMNMSANALGLGNAATPFGIRAMQELDKLNPSKGTATNAMVLFLAINTSSVTLLPTGVIALRASAGSQDPAGILPTTLFATILSTAIAILAVKLYQRFSPMPAAPGSAPQPADADEDQTAQSSEEAPAVADISGGGYPGWVSFLAIGIIAALVPLTVVYGKIVAPWIIPGLMLGFLSFGMARRVSVYEVFVEGARDGFQVAVRIIPYLVAILVAVGMLRASGALDLFVGWIGPATSRLGLPGEALPMALLRPLSGSGAYGIMASIIQDPAIGPDSYTGYLVSTLQGSTETTFYVLAVYFGAVQIRRVRHALAAALTADLAGIAGAIIACSVLYRPFAL